MPTKPSNARSARPKARQAAAQRPSPQTSPRAARLAKTAPPTPTPAAPAPAPTPPEPVVRRVAPARRKPLPAPPLGRRHRPLTWGFAVAAVAVVALASAGTMVSSQAGNSGTIKVHDGAEADPPQRNEPHVSGDVWIEGFNMAATEGTLEFFSWPPTGSGELVLSTTWEADGGEPANHFLAGPFLFPCGHYRVEAQNGLEEDDFPGGPKVKMFWVTDCPPVEEPPCEEPCEPEPEMVCPSGLAAVPNQDGSVTLTWTPAAGSDGTNVYRAFGDGDFEYVTTVGEGVGEFRDETTVAGTAYSYTVTGLYGTAESTDCPVVEVTAIPDFPTMLGFGLASAAGLLAFAMRRRS